MKIYFTAIVLLLQFALLEAQEPAQDSVQDEELEEIVLQSTRTSRTIKNTPTRVETIDAEELAEKANMKPANVSMVLHESTGIAVQQTSATSANASIRIQGLDGRYSQLLKDGYPNFGNFASGLSILEIPPLDLKQVEVIKGPASTLYGGGAIAGVVNFVSKTPSEKGEYNFLVNQSHIGQTNFGGFLSKKNGTFGYTMLALVNFQNDFDVDNDGFSELPESRNFSVNPRLFFYPYENTTILVGNSLTAGKSTGGDVNVIAGNADADHVYFEENKTIRNTTTLEFDREFDSGNSVKIKQSLSVFDRKISIPDYVFSGLNTNSFTDVSYSVKKEKHSVIAGANLIYDKFRQTRNYAANDLGNRTFTSGLYVQDTWDISENVILESGLRLDNVQFKNVNFDENKTFFLPRISGLYRITPEFSTRISGGFGYKIPTVFTEQTESVQYQNVLPMVAAKPERSIGGTYDLNYKQRFGDLQLSANQMFFYTDLANPLVLQQENPAELYFVNASRHVTTSGFETNLKFIFRDHYKLFAGYTFTDAKARYLEGNQFLPLVAKNRMNLVLLYEKHEDFKIGLEGYFTDKQFLYNGLATPSYWEFGLSAEKTFGKFSLYVNLENFTDERQSNYKSVVNGPRANPTFDDIWNHTEGFVFSGGVKYRL